MRIKGTEMGFEFFYKTTAGDAARKRAEITRAHLASIIESSDDAIISKDLEGIVTSWNAGAERIFGYSETEMIGRPVTLLIPPENPDEESQCIARIKGGERIEHYETCCVRKDGRRIDVSLTVLPIKDATGNIIGASKIARDITERKLAEESLRKSESFKDAIIKSALDALITIDHEGKIVEFNAAADRMFGFTRGEALGRRMAELIIPPHLRDAHHRGFAHYLATGEGSFIGKRLELTAMRADGTEFPVELSVTCIGSHATPMFTGHVRDITERKRAQQALQDSEQQLRAALEQREQLSRDLHDGIVQEIYAIGLGLEEAQRLIAEGEKRAEKKISDAIASLNQVIREVREHIIGSGPQLLTGQQLRTELAALAKTMRVSRSLRFRFDIDAMAVSRLSDDAASQVLNVTREAISNSLRHSAGRSGLISLQPYRDGVRLVVEDDGAGFDLQEARLRGRGLRNIEARADQLAAKLHIRSGTGHGTRIVLDIPAEHTDAAP